MIIFYFPPVAQTPPNQVDLPKAFSKKNIENKTPDHCMHLAPIALASFIPVPFSGFLGGRNTCH